MFRKPYLLLLMVAVMSLLAQPAMADSLLFNNGSLLGTDIGTVGYAEITGSLAVTDSFVISTTSNLTSITFGDWTYHAGSEYPPPSAGDLQSINFIIRDSAANIMQQGVGVPVTVTGETKNLYNFYVSDATFDLSVQLAAGTYYLTLTGALCKSQSYAFWDMNSASNSTASNLSGPISSEFFEIYGNTPTAAPEPATMLLLGLGLVGLAGVRRKFKQ
jgi:hypothetical protein